jgi:flagellum-specific peptidoglycan hydrolase FlgJ
MSTASFVAQIGPIVQKYAALYGYRFPSAIIAQACIESGYGTSSLAYRWHNYFGIKWWRGCGRSAVNLSTKEEYTPGVLTSITAGFAVGKDMEDGVRMYFEFIQRNSRYNNLKSATSSKNYIKLIRADGYATSSSYVTTVWNVVATQNLGRFDKQSAPVPVSYAGVITATALNVRTAPSTDAELLQVADRGLVLPKGLVVAIEAEFLGWGKLASVPGWVSLQYIKH